VSAPLYPLGRRCCGARDTAECHQMGLCLIAKVRPKAPGHIPATADLPTFGGEPSTPAHGHAGWPPDPDDALDRMRRGLPVYWPTKPVTIDQTEHLRFAAEKGPNSAR